MLIGGVNNGQQAQGIVPQLAGNYQNGAEQAEEPNGALVADVLELSAESQQSNRVKQDKQTDMEMLLKQLENAKAQGEAMGSMMEERIKCLRIAMNIMAGDKVPDENIRFLAEKDPELFARSMSMRRLDESANEAERVSEDEEDKSADSGEDDGGGQKSIGGSGKSPAPAKSEAPTPAAGATPAAEGGGEAAAE